MYTQRFALTGGLVLLAGGIAAFVPALSSIPPEGLPAMDVEQGYTLFLNLFAMNIISKIAWIVLGIYGIYAYTRPGTSLPASIGFSQTICWLMGALAVLGIFPQTNTLMGNWPLYGNLIWLHAVFSALGAYFGYSLTRKLAKHKVA